jgi:hypothetical protein
MERKWLHHLMTTLFALAVLLASASELRRDLAAWAGTPAASGRPGYRIRPTSFVSWAFNRMRWDGLQNALRVHLGQQ